MPLVSLLFAYLGWHYTLALRDFWVNAGNLIAFLTRFFSLQILFRTFFSPWRRLGESYKKGFYPGAWLETLLLNILMRAVGIFIRIWIVLAGLLATAAALVLAGFAFLLWLGLPLLWLWLVWTGGRLLFQ